MKSGVNPMLTRHPEDIQPAPQASPGFIVEQPYRFYSEENHETWRRLYARILPRWRRWANRRFLDGIDRLSLSPEKIPRIADINRFMEPLTGFRAKAVSGYIPAFLFFDCLRQREFPTTITIRDPRQLDYLPEPDIFHDVAGHVPMHTDKAFADTLVRFGEFARAAALMSREIRADHERLVWLTSVIQALARFFWFTIEFGLMRENGGLRAYGSGLLSSYGEIEHALMSNEVQRHPLQLEWVINQQFEIDHYQPMLFIIDSFEELFDLVGQLEVWLREGRLSTVKPGEPFIKEPDLRSFVHAVCD
jgi:phenylalanine-4-hydroxylase